MTDPDITPSLIQKLRCGDNQAGELLDSLYHEPLIRFAWGYLGNLDDARDAVGEVFYKVIRAEGVPVNFRAWIYRIARNHCLNVLRGRKRHPGEFALQSRLDLAASLTGNLTRMERAEERQRLLGALSTLSKEHQEALRLRYTEGLSRDEISEVLDVPVSTVKSRLFSALQQLRVRGLSGGGQGEDLES